MNRHLAAVPPPEEGPGSELERLAALVAAQLQYQQQPVHPPAPLPVVPQQSQVAAKYGGYVAAGAGAAAVLIPVLLATTAALVAVGMAALALAVSALVIRWIIRDMRR